MKNPKNTKLNFKWYASWWFILLMFILAFYTFGLTLFFVAISLLIRAYVLMRENKRIKKETTPIIKSQNQDKVSTKKPVTRVDFKVAGVSYDTDGKSRQMILSNAASFYTKEQGLKKYGGVTKGNIKDKIFEEGHVYEYVIRIDDIELEKEPGNQYDKNAIKVLIRDENEEMVIIGYVPKRKTNVVGELLEERSIKRVEGLFTGGKYKTVNADSDDEEVVVIERGERGFNVTLHLIG